MFGLNEFGLNEFELAIGLGVALFVLCIVVIVIDLVCGFIYGFINDSEYSGQSSIINKLAKSMGYTEGDSESFWRFDDDKQEEYSGVWVFMQLAVPLSLSPFLILIAFKLYSVTLFLVSATALVFLARFAFRAKKLMDKHIADKDAHKA